MKKSQRDHISSIDEFEDLTLFANESFDTQDVDLFEFTSEESSPLTRLKSIILSLDWEINDEILQELDDELENLQSVWTDDKVAEVYLQGLKKIGNYIRTKGAYAHPNSIKLLLTFYYNFEKIISSEKITGEEITRLLKGDVRKFKILQYQINQSEADTATQSVGEIPANEPVEEVAATPVTESDISKQLKAAILSLDWEVTDDSLRQFNDRLAGFHQRMADNKPALVLAQGLQALGDYIADERADAHPEAFILLHSFNDALEQVLKTGAQRLEQSTIQDLLVDQINRLNNLKLLIASPSGTLVDDQRIDEMVEELSAPPSTEAIAEEPMPRKETVAPTLPETAAEPLTATADATPEAMDATGNLEAEIDTFFAIDSMPAMESADVQYPDEVLPPDAIHPVDDELADDFIEAHLSSKRGLMPALSDADESSGFDENEELLDVRAQSDLADQLDFLFADAEGDDDSSVTFSALDSTDLELAIDNEEELEDEEAPAFSLKDDIEELEEGPIAALTAMDEAIEEGTAAVPADEDEEEAEDGVVAALSDALEPEARSDFDGGFIADDASGADLDIESKLDSFFVDAEEETAEPVDAPQATVEEIEDSLFFNEEDRVQAALADSEEEHGFSEEAEVATLSFTPMDEIEEKLDFFFGSESDEEAEPDEYRKELAASDLLDASLNLTFDTPEATPSVEPALAGFAPEEVSEDLEDELDEAEQSEASLVEELALFSSEAARTQEPGSTTVDELTSALEATIGEGQEAPAAESLQIQLAALGAILPGIVRAPTYEKLAEAAALVAPLKQTGLSAEQLALVQLLDAVITMLVRLPTKDAAETEKLVNYLYGLLLAEHCPPRVLPEAVVRYTAWLQQASTIMPVVPVAAGQDQDAQYAYTAKELYFELSELRTHIREEFAKLRHEMHHLKT